MEHSNLRTQIIRDGQIKKFCAYGLLKNLKFFEAYLILFLMSQGISLLEVGILIAVREAIVNLFEIPSGIIADYFGRKKELYLCFFFYMIAFVFFFMSNAFWLAMIAMIFYGLGEAFRSGTHKAMIYTYLDQKGWSNEKSFVYGRTRSFSLIGSGISSLIGIILILAVPDVRYIFLFSIIPYLLDWLLIVSYPQSLDRGDKTEQSSIKELLTGLYTSFRDSGSLRGLLLEEGLAEATFSYAKDFVQPILELLILGSGIVIISGLSADDHLKVVLGLTYAAFNLCGAIFSKRAYLLNQKRSSISCLQYIHGATAVILALLALFTGHYFVVLVGYLGLYICHSVRKPIFVDEVDDHIEKSTRASVLSIAAQLKSICLMVIAPLAGWAGDTFGLGASMLVLCGLFILSAPLLKKHK